MRRRQVMRQQRGAGGAVAQEIDVPLPLRGLFVEGRTAEVSGLYASRLDNLRSSGVSLEVVKSVSYEPSDETALRRIPFEFGGQTQYVEIRASEVIAGAASLVRASAADASHGYISSQVLIADGQGAPFRYDGIRFTEPTWTTDTGLDAAEFDGVVVHQDRPYFWRTGGDLEFYYGDVGAVEGDLTRFPLGRLGNITGQIIAAFSLTLDAMENPNDNLCIVTSTGYLVMYEGLDPGDPNDWQLVGRVKTGPPLSKHGFARVGGDTWMITPSGIVSVLDSLKRGILSLVGNISRPITDDIQAAAALETGDWQLHTSAVGDAIILNYVVDGTAKQWIYQTESEAWNTATYNALFWHNIGRKTEFTTPSGVLGSLLETGTPTENVTATWVSSWFFLKRYSQITYLHPTIIARGALQVTVRILSDHDETDVDIAEAEQTITIEPDAAAGSNGRVSLNEIIGIDAVGAQYQIQLEITAPWFEIVSMKAGVM